METPLLNRKLLLPLSALVAGLVATAVYAATPPASSSTAPGTRSIQRASSPERPAVREMGVQLRGKDRLSHWVGMVSRIDNRPAVVCDDRELTLATNVQQFEDFAVTLRAAGVTVTGPAPAWRFGCDDAPSPFVPASASNLSQPMEAVEEQPETFTWMKDVAAGEMKKVKSRPDFLAERGWLPAGCIEMGGKLTALMRSPEGFSASFSRAEYARSNVSSIKPCRI